MFQKMKKNTMEHVAIIPGCVALGCCDIGRCETEEGKSVYITWGRNLTKKQAEYLQRTTYYRAIEQQETYKYEIILPDNIAEKLLSICNI